MKKHFRLESFRPLQREIIQHTLNQRDAFVILPTGGGKSLCYQLPAVLSKGMTLVISPLISLMQDQCANLKQRGIAAVTLNTRTPASVAKPILQQMKQGRAAVKLLYVSPEKVKMFENEFVFFLKKFRFCL